MLKGSLCHGAEFENGWYLKPHLTRLSSNTNSCLTSPVKNTWETSVSIKRIMLFPQYDDDSLGNFINTLDELIVSRDNRYHTLLSYRSILVW